MEKVWIFVQTHISLSKYISKKILEAWKMPQSSILYPILSIFVLQIIICTAIPLMLCFYIYKRIIIFLLHLKIGSKFISLITGTNFSCSLSETNGFVISTVLYFDSKEVWTELMQKLRREILTNFDNPAADRKLFSVRKQFMGYFYFEEFKNVDTSKLFQYVQLDGEDENAVLQYHCSEKPLPYDGKFNWDLTLFSYSELSDNGKTKYLLSFRMHHFVVDGLTLFNLTKVFMVQSDELENYGKNIASKLTAKPKRKILTTIRNLTAITSPIKISNSSPSHSKPLFNLYLEPTKCVIPKLKQIKEIFPGTSLIQIILTAYSASLANYFLHNTPENIPIPETFNILSPLQINADKFSSFISGPARLDNLNNDFAFVNYYIPIVPKDKKGIPIENYMIERMEAFKEEMTNIENSMDALLNNMLLNTYFEVFPVKIIQFLLDRARYNGIVTIFPGGSKRSFFTGDVINDNFFMVNFLPQRANINLCGFTYDNRIQLAQLADPEMFENKEDFDKILPNFSKYVDILHAECLKHK